MSTVSSTNQVAQNVLAGLGRSEPVNTKKADDPQTRFLTLLTTQLRNQDPMNPMENAEVTSQLAQMSTVDGIERLNKLFQSFVDSQSSSDGINAAGLIGRGVLVEGKGLGLTEAGAVGGFTLDTAADKVVLTIRDASGIAISTVELSDVEAGSHNYLWDGTASDGTRAADGMYSVSMEANANGEKVKGQVLQFAAVTSVIRGPNGTDLQVGSLGVFKLDDIKQIL